MCKTILGGCSRPAPARRIGSRSRVRRFWLPAVAVFLSLTGCGYKVASANRADLGISSISVLPLENDTLSFAVEQILTRALVHSFVEKSPWRVVKEPARADAVVQGVITRVTARQVTFGSRSFGSTFLVTVTASLSLRDRRSKQILFQEDRYIFREEYVINPDVKNFFSELNPALQRLGADFGASVVSTVLEGF